MSEGFLPKGDKVHQLIPQRPGAFIAVSEQGRIFEVMALMDNNQVMTREWEALAWDDEKAETETARVKQEIARVQMAQQGGGPQQGKPQRAPSGIIKPGQVARPGTM